MPDVFISYSRDDRSVARSFAEGFEREGFSVWWDQALNPGEAFDQVTEQALEDAKAVVVLWSKASVNSRWVRAEATQASANNRLLPVMIEDCRRPIIFELTHTVDLSNWSGDTDDPEWKSVVISVRRFVERAVPPRSAAPAAVASRRASATPPAADVASAPRALPARGAAKAAPGLPRRQALLYGASALGLVAAGFTGGVMLRGERAVAPVRPPMFHRVTFRRGLLRSARFAPDGKTIYYGALWDGEACRVHSTRIDSPESQALDLPNANLLAVSRTGELALSIGPNLDGIFTYGTLARVPITGGAPRELVERVKFADWSPDGHELAVIRDVGGIDQLEYPLGNVIGRPQDVDGSGLGFARVSPDGQQLAFVHYRAPQSLNGRVCLADRSGKVAVLTDSSVNIHGLAWQGDEIWYSASDDRPLFRALMAVKPGTASRVVARMPVNVTLWDTAPDGRLLIAQTEDRSVMIARQQDDSHERDLSWLDASLVVDVSRDGRKLLFNEFGQGVDAESAAYLRSMDGSPAVRLGKGWALALSPDTLSALISRTVQQQDGTAPVVDIVPTGAGESLRLPGAGSRMINARWLPDGHGLVVHAVEQGRQARLFHVVLPDGTRRPITPEGIGGWALSPDGSTVAATSPESDIRLYPVTGDTVQVVPRTTNVDSLVGWIDAGLLVMRFADPTAPRGEVYLLEPGTGQRRSWANLVPRENTGLMWMSRFVATPDGRTQVFTWHRSLSNLYVADGLT
ncbi:MAG: toll/interleukin-1 receptor domain-containing protein [Burkholderiales bacterium]|nr:toll/interleukin-1 receptor domain-containing protein [Burkholderiales bacterium]